MNGAANTSRGRGNFRLTAGGLVRKTIYLEPDDEAAFRQKAFKERCHGGVMKAIYSRKSASWREKSDLQPQIGFLA